MPANKPWKKPSTWIITAVLYTLAIAGIIWWLFLPRKSFRIDAQLMVERVSFRYLEGPASFAQGQVQYSIWQNFSTFNIDAAYLFLDEDMDGAYEEVHGGPAKRVLRADPDVSGLGIHFGAARLEKIRLATGAQLTLSLPEENDDLFRMIIDQEEPLQGAWIYKDSLIVQTEQVEVEGIFGHEAFLYPVRLKLLPPRDLAREFIVRSFPGSTTLDLVSDQKMSLESEQLFVTNLSFFKPVETVAVPTVLQGQIRIAEVNREPFQEISLREGEDLNIVPVDRLALQQVKIEDGALHLHLSGQVTQLNAGADYELRNPTRLEWLWHNQRTLLLTLWAALIGLAAASTGKMAGAYFFYLKNVEIT